MDLNGLVCVVCNVEWDLEWLAKGVVGLDYRLVEARLVISDWSSIINRVIIDQKNTSCHRSPCTIILAVYDQLFRFACPVVLLASLIE
ncbi:hypothetical protein T07_11407 [Trichinella nelsoni]|uniref:Uncharacterized protein n=1 Tax=Trichinella nelsoni TaxID=6336 RepID=A0A0V0SMR8_9BILA|nr:hypothetical protein T07_11407 [Trichinella nelsoni]